MINLGNGIFLDASAYCGTVHEIPSQPLFDLQEEYDIKRNYQTQLHKTIRKGEYPFENGIQLRYEADTIKKRVYSLRSKNKTL